MPRTRVLQWCLLLALVGGTPATAQELFRLESGEIVEGKRNRRAKPGLLQTPLGYLPVEGKYKALAKADHQSLVARYRQQVEALPDPKFVGGRFAIARWALDQGLYSGVREQLEAILDMEVDHAASRALVTRLARRFLFDPREGSERGRDQRALARELFGRHAAAGAVTALMAREKLNALPKDIVFRAALKGLKHGEAPVRFIAVQLLADYRQKPTRIKPLLDRSLSDRNFAVRREAVRSLGVTKDPVFVKLFAKNFAHPEAAVRRNAAEAMAEFGRVEAVAPLIRLLENGGGPVRSNITISTQRAYVKDFDVEVAQGAIIADPIVDIVQDGTVLDVGMVGVSVVRRTAFAALARITGESFGTDVAAWRRWEHERRKENQ